ncbi:MAG: glycosyltransferase family A protein [Candidatus Levybacteria bacterium]|nr:glycosyltransferase family A protein [Candidatus Levybacteria bacterium]
MKKISVMIAFVSNPYMAFFQYLTYKKYWKDEVDEVLVNVNGRNERIRNLIAEFWGKDDKVKFIDNYDGEIRQGHAFNNLWSHVTGNVVMVVDSDNFIYAPGVVKYYSELVYKNVHTAVGSTGFHAVPKEVAEKAIKKYGTVRLNPFMAFFRKDIADKIKDIDFRTRGFVPGDVLPCFGKMTVKGWVDVLGMFCLQYFEIGKNYFRIYEKEPGKYMHATGLSSMFRRQFRSLEEKNIFVEGSYTKGWLAGYAWYQLMYEKTKHMVPDDYNREYEKMFAFNIKNDGIGMEKVNMIVREFKTDHKGLDV